MPIVASFDGANRRILLDSSVINSSFKPIDIYREHRQWRLLESSQKWLPLVSMSGGAPKGGGEFEARSLVLLTDNNGLTTKIVPPNHTGGYRTLIDGEMRTDVADTDPETFDLTSVTVPAILDYKPPSTEIVTTSGGSGLSTQQAETLDWIYRALWHDSVYDSNTQLMTIYAADGVTPLRTFNVTPEFHTKRGNFNH